MGQLYNGFFWKPGKMLGILKYRHVVHRLVIGGGGVRSEIAPQSIGNSFPYWVASLFYIRSLWTGLKLEPLPHSKLKKQKNSIVLSNERLCTYSAQLHLSSVPLLCMGGHYWYSILARDSCFSVMEIKWFHNFVI